jgi:uncharacterized membrane protein
MSRLRKSVLNALTEVGNQSGCHQLPERSFFIKDYQFPVCARCTGVLIGQAAAIIFSIIFKPISIKKAILMLSVMGFDWGIQEFKVKESTNTRRFITGILGGYGLFTLYIQLIQKILSKFVSR